MKWNKIHENALPRHLSAKLFIKLNSQIDQSASGYFLYSTIEKIKLLQVS